MERRVSIDLFGVVGLLGFNTVLAMNQVVIKVTNDGLGPIFGAGLRSAIALCVLGLWMAWRGQRPVVPRSLWGIGLVFGLLFTVEFLFLFLALDLTTVSRASIAFYSMPIWTALAAHFLLPGERLTPLRAAGLVIAMAGVALALWEPESRAAGDWRGDALAVAAALSWTAIALVVRITPLSAVPAETQLFWQLAVSAVFLTALAPAFGPLLREPGWIHWAGLGYQSVVVASLAFLFWLTLMRIYRASDIASFSFLAPVLSVGLGAVFLGDPVGPGFVGALLCVGVGIVLIARAPRR